MGELKERMGAGEFEDWKYYLMHEHEIFRSPELTGLFTVAYEIAVLSYIQSKNALSGAKIPQPEIEKYLPSKLKNEIRLTKHQLAKKNMTDAEWKVYYKAEMEKIHGTFRAAFGFNKDGSVSGKKKGGILSPMKSKPLSTKLLSTRSMQKTEQKKSKNL